jgi:hypothetical protein
MKKPNLSRIPKRGLLLAILLIVSTGYNYAFSREHLATAKMEEARKQKENMTIPEIIIMPVLPQNTPGAGNGKICIGTGNSKRAR